MAIKVGIQLYSVRNALAARPYETLDAVAKLGYKYVEAANHNAAVDDGVGFGVPAENMKATLDKNGMQIVGCHVNPLRLDRLPAVLEYHQKLGNKQIGCDIEFFPYMDMDYLKRRCEFFNAVGRKCKEYGLRYYYHNHYQEFQKFGDQTVYDFIMENTDPEYVFIEMDTYWITRGGYDPIDYINKYKDRIVLIHQKDFPADAPQPICMFDGIIMPDADITHHVFSATKYPVCFTEVGTGVLPIQSIIDALADAPNLEYLILEQDFTSYADELESIKVSMDAFKNLRGIQLV